MTVSLVYKQTCHENTAQVKLDTRIILERLLTLCGVNELFKKKHSEGRVYKSGTLQAWCLNHTR